MSRTTRLLALGAMTFGPVMAALLASASLDACSRSAGQTSPAIGGRAGDTGGAESVAGNPNGGDIGASGASEAGASAGENGNAGEAGANAGTCAAVAPVAQTLPQGATLLDNEYAYYPRVIRLEHSGARNGTIIASVVRKNANHDHDWVGHLVQSSDNGLTFSPLGDVDDPTGVDGSGMCCQTLFELPVAIGAMPAGTLLWAASFGGNVVTQRRMAQRVWQSSDSGKTWSFLSTISTTATTAGTWEPEFTVSADGHLVVFYSDETDPAHSQKLVAWRTSNGLEWTDYQPVVASNIFALRPGMAVVRKTPDGNWLMSYEVCSTDNSHVCEAHVRSSPDGWNWGDPADLGENVQLSDGEFPASTPTLTVSGKTVLLKAMRQRNSNLSFAAGDGKAIFANTNNGHGPWFEVPAPVTMADPGQGSQAAGYSNPLLGSADGKAVLLIATDYGADRVIHAYYGAGPIGPEGGLSMAEGAQALLVAGAPRFFARSSSGLLERWLPAGPSKPWGTGTTAIVDEPVAVIFKNQEHIFARSRAGELAHWYANISTGTGSHDIWGTGISGTPAALVVGNAEHAWATDGTGALQHWWWNANEGIQRDTWAQGTTGRPSAVLDSSAQHVFVRTQAGALLHLWWDTQHGKQQELLEKTDDGSACAEFPRLASDPVATIIGGAQHAWAIDVSGALQHFWWNPGQTWRYETWGSDVVGRPAIMQVGDAQHAFVRGTSGALLHFWWSSTQGLQHDEWSGSVTIAEDPVALLDGVTQDVFARDEHGELHRWTWSAATGLAHESWGP